MKRPALASVVLVLACALAGCGGSDSADPGSRAAEPASAPPTSAPPTGAVKRVGALPQGIVYAAAQDLVAVAVHDPYRLLILDPETLATLRSVPLPGKARHLQTTADGSEVLVGAETANVLVEVPLPDGPPRTTQVQEHPHDATGAPDGTIVVGNEFSGSLSVIRDGQVVRTIGKAGQPGGVVADGNTLAVVDVRGFTVSTYDLATLTRTARVAAGAGPTHGVLLGDHRLAVADTRGGDVLLFSLDPLRQVGSLQVGGSPYGLASDPTTDTVWVTLTARNQVVGLDVSGSTPRVIARYPTVRQPDTVAVAPGSHTLWVAGTVDGEVQRITR